MSNDRALSESRRLSLDALLIALSESPGALSNDLQTQLNQLGQSLQQNASATIDQLVAVISDDPTLGPLYEPIRDQLADSYQAQPRKAIITPKEAANLPESLKNTIQSGDRLALATEILTAQDPALTAQTARKAIQQSSPPNPEGDDNADTSWLRGFGA